MINLKFSIALLSIIIYQTLIEIIKPMGLPIVKAGITLLIWISFFLSFSDFLNQYQNIKRDISRFNLNLFLILIAWNIFNIFRSSIYHDETLLTHLGNPVTSLALLVPFSFSFYYQDLNLKTFSKIVSALIIVGIPIYIIYLVFSNGSHDIDSNKAIFYFLYGVNFLIPFLPFQVFSRKVIILLGSILLFYLALVTQYRIANIRILLLFSIVLFFYVFNKKLFLYTAFFSLALPFWFLIDAFHTGESLFQKYASKNTNEELYTDTRSFLYEEVFADLQNNNCLIWGKGSSGKYYSPYFDKYGGDTDKRLSVEVGFLALLLKGGIIAVILNLLLLFIAIFNAFFKSNNDFITCIGLMLTIHVLIFFISNYLDYSLNNVALWFFVGICLSNKFRSYSNEDIKKLLFYE